jgi:hypothetical protein
VTSPLRGARLMSYSQGSAPTFLLMWSRASCITPLPCPAWAETAAPRIGQGGNNQKLKMLNKKTLPANVWSKLCEVRFFSIFLPL